MFEDDIIMDAEEHCPCCGGVLKPLGVLGKRVHLQCQDCGALASFAPADRAATEPPLDEQDA
jgi:hypothetical protein